MAILTGGGGGHNHCSFSAYNQFGACNLFYVISS